MFYFHTGQRKRSEHERAAVRWTLTASLVPAWSWLLELQLGHTFDNVHRQEQDELLTVRAVNLYKK